MNHQRTYMRYLVVSLLILLSFTGCEDKEKQAQHDAQVAQKARAELLAELEAQKKQQETKDAKLNKMGIHVDNGTITIDTNKTKNFFHALGKRMDAQMNKMAEELERGIIEHKEAGVEITEQHIHIDLNKTRDLLMDWGEKIEVFVQEFDEMAKALERNSTNTTNKGM